jgi:hypothetical protein
MYCDSTYQRKHRTAANGTTPAPRYGLDCMCDCKFVRRLTQAAATADAPNHPPYLSRPQPMDPWT